MTVTRWVVLAGLVGLLWLCPIFGRFQTQRLGRCWKRTNQKHIVVADNYNGIIKKKTVGRGLQDDCNIKDRTCIIFLATKSNAIKKKWNRIWPQMENDSNSLLLLVTKFHTKNEIQMHVLHGKYCSETFTCLQDSKDNLVTESCTRTFLNTKDVCKESIYDKKHCTSSEDDKPKNKYFINVTATTNPCVNCNNPKKVPEEKIDLYKEMEDKFNLTINTAEGNSLDPVAAVKVMSAAADLASSINGSSAALNLAEGISGVLVRETESTAVDTVSFGYSSVNEDINIIDDEEFLKDYSRSVTVPKQAFEAALSLNVSVAFAALMRFSNFSKGTSNSTVLDNQALAVEMGAEIKNLTDKINITFANLKYRGIPSCQSWNGEGNQPNWTDYGCETIVMGENITCQCSHLTFFAILMTPLNETISTSDFNILTVITQVGCSLSMFFLSMVLFTHFFIRKTKASTTTIIFIHLVFALFSLNFTFLINTFVADMKNAVGCKIMAAVMHYFLLATFTWFAVQAFHLCLQLHTKGKIGIQRYVLKVSITSWGLPGIVGIILLSMEKYGELVIYTENPESNVVMCWITDYGIHYVINIGYYAVVFLFTFTTFIIILSWLVCLKRSKAKGNNKQSNQTGISMMTVMGLCSMLGVTWGFAFFTHGDLLVTASYIFTILNSFQGFFLFIYYNSSNRPEKVGNHGSNSQTTSSNSTLKTVLQGYKNPYCPKQQP